MIRNRTPNDYVGPQVRNFRKRKGWTQRKLADRLHELGMTTTGWSQSKVAKLESGKLAHVLVDDVFELAAALDVSPLYLLTPVPGADEEDVFKVWIGGKVARWPREVRQWIRGVRPLLHRLDYGDDEAATAGQRFYLFESQPLSEWHLINESGSYAQRVAASLEGLMPTEESEEER